MGEHREHECGSGVFVFWELLLCVAFEEEQSADDAAIFCGDIDDGLGGADGSDLGGEECGGGGALGKCFGEIVCTAGRYGNQLFDVSADFYGCGQKIVVNGRWWGGGGELGERGGGGGDFC